MKAPMEAQSKAHFFMGYSVCEAVLFIAVESIDSLRKNIVKIHKKNARIRGHDWTCSGVIAYTLEQHRFPSI